MRTHRDSYVRRRTRKPCNIHRWHREVQVSVARIDRGIVIRCPCNGRRSCALPLRHNLFPGGNKLDQNVSTQITPAGVKVCASATGPPRGGRCNTRHNWTTTRRQITRPSPNVIARAICIGPGHHTDCHPYTLHASFVQRVSYPGLGIRIATIRQASRLISDPRATAAHRSAIRIERSAFPYVCPSGQ